MKEIIAAGGLVFNEDGDLLMIFRRGRWDLPKGKLDDDEQIKDCAVREVKEETGLRKLHVKRFLGITYHKYFDTHINEEVIKETHWFEMIAKGDQKLTPQTEEDIERIEWVDQKNIPEKLQQTYPNIAEIIEKMKETPNL
jgi:8-oxo-dGTP pyrophosphatase MutT (NUDIX family)